MHKHNTKCRICKSEELTKFLDLGDQPLANSFLKNKSDFSNEKKYPLAAYFCHECNLAQLLDVVNKEEMFADYIYFSSGMPKLSNHFQVYAEDVVERFLEPGNFVVEIASNDGILLKFFKDLGYRALGVDPAENVVKVADRVGVETIVDYFSEVVGANIAEKHGKAKIIMANNVVAHIDDHHDLVKGIDKLLDEDGVFVMEAPYLIDMFENLTYDTIYHEHLSFLAVRPLKKLFEQYGFEIFDVEVHKVQGRSLRLFVGRAGKHSVSNSVQKWIDRELELGLNSISAYSVLAQKVKAQKQKLVGLLTDLKNSGKKIAAYGAPAKGNTMLNYCGLDDSVLNYALEDLQAKQGLFTPGMHIPTIDSVSAHQNLPDYFLLLAWNYLEVILEKEKDFLEAGGSFILPSGEVISSNSKLKSVPKGDRKKILICGGSGFIGSNFIRHLYNKYEDYELFNLDLLTYSGNQNNLLDITEIELGKTKENKRYNFIHGNICDKVFLDNLFSNNKFDVVVNFAAESHVDRSLCSSYDFINTNIVGTHMLVEECRIHGIPRFLQISTDEVYGDIPEGHSTEMSSPNPSNPYAASKASADLVVRSYIRSHGLPALIIRGSNNFGPYQYPEKLIPLAISNLIEDKKIPVHGDGMHIRSWIYVNDFCNAIDIVIHKGEDGHIYNVSGTPKTNLEILGSIRDMLALEKELSECVEHTNDRPGADLRYAPDSTKLSQNLGWSSQHNFEDAMKHTVEWYINNEAWWKDVKNKEEFIKHYDRQQRADYY
ncbi:MAG: dTDP-glucose 4,6-dehydratase [Candidatus Magasanikbacteria bacterium]|jgi:dTDP-glucose 4,6-dehydratase|nr:dTDP-glucose 4,6-dehydratase [Candidatus Magasanikbacteria bacterium]MBT4314824.1 dTDP-glucose 4,6-dehydratase [Candidatus Magasanikbacteria bacterium]MBT4547601.1 dTDP-glucose 4,6-dehydratase [Candidatus Magasanikbacteria bacterium]MBT6819231.1 dTDP-glucose 4,6-dehydratase [Candidatus Magasanikbacteria bacterium]